MARGACVGGVCVPGGMHGGGGGVHGRGHVRQGCVWQ